MLDHFIYENHLGQRFDGLENGVYLNIGDLRNYAWTHEAINNRISRFYRKITNRKIPLYVMGRTDEQAVYAMNRLLDMTESDIASGVPGRIFAEDYYTRGFITASKKTSYLDNRQLCKIDLTLTSDDSSWYHDTTYVFHAGEQEGSQAVGGFEYAFDYAYDYALVMNGKNIVCDSVFGSAFRLLIYGECVNPTVNIGGHAYTVNGVVGNGETLRIDSEAKNVVLTTAYGNTINYFDKRGRESYLFESIPAGKNAVTWPGDFGFDLTVIEKRSEPKWT